MEAPRSKALGMDTVFVVRELHGDCGWSEDHEGDLGSPRNKLCEPVQSKDNAVQATAADYEEGWTIDARILEQDEGVLRPLGRGWMSHIRR